VPEKFGERVRRIRKARGLGLRELGKMIGRSAGLLSRIESSDPSVTPPTEEVIKSLATALGQDFDELVTLAGRIPDDVKPAITSDAGMPAFLRRVMAEGLSAADLDKMLDRPKGGKR